LKKLLAEQQQEERLVARQLVREYERRFRRIMD